VRASGTFQRRSRYRQRRDAGKDPGTGGEVEGRGWWGEVGGSQGLPMVPGSFP
jgi:hypothetical protein